MPACLGPIDAAVPHDPAGSTLGADGGFDYPEGAPHHGQTPCGCVGTVANDMTGDPRMLQRLAMVASAGALVVASSTGQGAAQSVLTTDWSGLYAGAQIGWGWADGDATLEVDGAGYDGDVDGSSLNYGFTVGYRHDLGSYVVGGEAQFDWSDTTFEDVEVDGLAGSVDDGGRLKDMWRIVGLAGYDTGRTLFYGTLGWARASIKTPSNTFDGGGWVVGAGADYLVTDRITVGGQLSYHVFEDVGEGRDSFDLDVTRLQARMTYRF